MQGLSEVTLETDLMLPGFSADSFIAVTKMMKLEQLGDVELIRPAIIWEGKFWVWMRPDRYALLLLLIAFIFASSSLQLAGFLPLGHQTIA